LNSSITDNITVGEVFSQNAAARFLFLSDLIGIPVGVGGVGATIVGFVVSGSDRNLRRAKLRVVQELGRLGSGLLLKSYGGILGAVGSLCDLDVGDLAAVEASESVTMHEAGAGNLYAAILSRLTRN
jgi:hypothetical protein